MSKKIFVIEDNDDIRENLKEILFMEGYEVSQYANGLEGWEALRKSGNGPDLILLDLMMPVMDGYQLLDEIDKDAKLKQVPIVVLTADGLANTKLKPGRVQAFVNKPVELETFLGIIESNCR